MTKDLYVRNISAEATEDDLRKLFSVVGKVSYIHMVTDSKTGQFKGCAYVKMSTEAEAKEAIPTLDGAHLINRMISIREALPQKPKAGGEKAPSAAMRPVDKPDRSERSSRPGKPARPKIGKKRK
jgi:RNA recognition motif-containing protein